MASWKKAMEELGFTGFVEVGLGGDLTAKSEAQEWREAYEEGKKKVTSCCPGFVNMVRKHYPELSDAISTTVSPMCGVSRLIKAKDPEAKLHTSLVDEDHVKYTSLSFYEKGMIVCRGKNLNGSLIVENTATNHDDEIEREKIEALANDLTELAKQIS